MRDSICEEKSRCSFRRDSRFPAFISGFAVGVREGTDVSDDASDGDVTVDGAFVLDTDMLTVLIFSLRGGTVRML